MSKARPTLDKNQLRRLEKDLEVLYEEVEQLYTNSQSMLISPNKMKQLKGFKKAMEIAQMRKRAMLKSLDYVRSYVKNASRRIEY